MKNKLITLEQAIEKIEEKEKYYKVGTAYDVGHSFVLILVDPDGGEEPDFSPFGVNKKTGKVYEYFPPFHRGELSKAKKITII